LEFSAVVIDVSEKLPDTRAGNHLAGQLLRSGTSPYGNHGEAQAPESAEDFIHKMKVCLKELREAHRWAKLIERKGWLGSDAQLVFVLGEGDELIRIFKSSVQTAERNRQQTHENLVLLYLPDDCQVRSSRFEVQGSRFKVRVYPELGRPHRT
jgi:four helix bundle protein